MPTDLDDFLFDLRGYLVVEQAIDAGHVADLNAAFDAFPDLAPGEWWGNSQRLNFAPDTLGFELHNCVEAGEPFERLIDHPSWVDHARHYAGEEGKSNLPHPNEGDYAAMDRMDALEGAIEVHLRAGDALLFADGLMHGAASNVNGRERRVVIYRYGPSWGATRFGYEYSPELLARLTKPRRRILQPIRPARPPASG